MSRILALAAALFLSLPAQAHEFAAGDLRIIHPHIPQPSASANSAGGFMSIVNTGTQPDRLIGVESAIAARTELHESRIDASGIGTMVHVDAIALAPGATVGLQHGGYHVMFLGLSGPLTEGALHKATLIFERAGRVEVEFAVNPPLGQGGSHDGMNHDGMNHGEMHHGETTHGTGG